MPKAAIKSQKKSPAKKAQRRSRLTNGIKTDVFSVSGRAAGTVELPRQIFDVALSDKLLAQYVRVYLANQHQGTRAAKTRGQVKGSTRKIYKQKGTGRARHGDIKAPIFVGGGVTHGPTPTSPTLKLNKKQRRAALFGSLSSRLRDRDILFVKGLLDVEPKTKKFAEVMKNLKLDRDKRQSFLVVSVARKSNSLIRSSRNLPMVDLCDASTLNAYVVLHARKILFPVEGLEVLSGLYMPQAASKKS